MTQVDDFGDLVLPPLQEVPLQSQKPILSPNICHALVTINNCLDQDKILKVLQLCMLTLPPAKRRKLHVLVQFMARLCENPHLAIWNKRSTK